MPMHDDEGASTDLPFDPRSSGMNLGIAQMDSGDVQYGSNPHRFEHTESVLDVMKTIYSCFVLFPL